MAEEFYDDEQIARQLAVAQTQDMRTQRNLVLSALQLQLGHRILDLGSGNGVFADELCDAVGADGSVTGADASQGMVEMAQRIAPRAQFVQADATALPFDDASFDRVTAAQILCFVPDLNAALAEIFCVLAPGGRIALLDSDWASLVWHSDNTDLTAKIMERYTSVYADRHVARRLAPELARAGFTEVDVTSHVILNRSVAEDTYAGITLAGAVDMAAADADIGPAKASLWEADMHRADQSGRAFFSLNRYIFTAKKPRI